MSPETVFLNKRKHALELARSIANGDPVVIDFGATYGTAFLADTNTRMEVARRRYETEPLDTVSLVAPFATALNYYAVENVHPLLQPAFTSHVLQIIESIAFLRAPANQTAINALAPHFVNTETGEIQFFFVPSNDPLISALSQFGIEFYAVRSSNIHGQPESYQPHTATEYARQIGASHIAHLSPSKLITHALRRRTMSQPAIHIPAGLAEIRIARQGNTHPEALTILLSDTLQHGKIKITVDEDKPNRGRHLYNPLNEQGPFEWTPDVVAAVLRIAAGLDYTID